MKKKLFIIAPLLFGLSFLAMAKEGENGKQPTVSQVNQAITTSVKEELSSFLEIIPTTLEKEHGFNDRSEFTKAVPASIYRITNVSKEGNVFETNLYNVIVSVNNQYRAVLTVSFENGKYEIQTVGAAELAKELQLVEIQNPLPSEKEWIMVNMLTQAASFVSYNDINAGIENADLIPLESAKTGLQNASGTRATKSTYKLAEVVQALKVN
ncbi:MAG: hypothetical protein ABI315_07045 [Bacteroidia bacterium]